MENKQQYSVEVIDRKLRAKDWSTVDGGKLKQLAALRDKISDNTMSEIIKAIPEFSETAKDSLSTISKTFETTINNNILPSSITKACKVKMKALEKMLEQDDLTFEEKKYVMDEMSVIINDLAKADKENKRFLTDIFVGTSTALVGVFALLVSVVNNKD